MKHKLLIIALVLFAITAFIMISGCTSGSPTNTPAASATPTPTPAPTPAPAYEFKPSAKTWPINVTNFTYFLYKRTNNIVKPDDAVNYQSWEYKDLAVDNSTKIQRLIYNDSQEGRGTATITRAYFELPSGNVINVSRWTVAFGEAGTPMMLAPGDVMGFDLRQMADWRCKTERPNETITVPAGTFECRKYVTMYYDNVTSAIWMADFVPVPVKREMYGNNKTNVVYELMSYQMGPRRD